MRWFLDDCAAIDIGDLGHSGCVRRGKRPWHPSTCPFPVELNVGLDTIEISDWTGLTAIAGLEWTTCNYGGARPWFLCSYGSCERRARKLFKLGQSWRCRSCTGLAYASQWMDSAQRAMCRADRIRVRLGGDPSWLAPFPRKPRGMHWDSYDRLRWQVLADERIYVTQAIKGFERRSRRLGV